mgnify:CR=1 FL=1
MPNLRGEKVLLRPYRAEDLHDICAWANDTETTQYLSRIFWFPQTAQDTEGFLNMMLTPSRDRAAFVMADPVTEEYWGQVDVFTIDWQNRAGEIGMVMGKSDMRSRGIGTEALMLLQDYVFGTLGLHRVEIEVHADNARARRCYEKAGFREEGRQKDKVYKQGHWVDMIKLAMLRGEWDALRGRKEEADV